MTQIIARLFLAALLVSACGCGGAQMTPADGIQVGVETEQQRECVDRYADAGRPAVDGCRAQVRATWDHYWAATLDGGGQ